MLEEKDNREYYTGPNPSRNHQEIKGIQMKVTTQQNDIKNLTDYVVQIQNPSQREYTPLLAIGNAQ